VEVILAKFQGREAVLLGKVRAKYQKSLPGAPQPEPELEPGPPE
jgi:hypothetical protein